MFHGSLQVLAEVYWYTPSVAVFVVRVETMPATGTVIAEVRAAVDANGVTT
jgi:hypothetical protein